MEYIKYVGATITIALGFMGLLFPKKAADFTGLSWKTAEGFSEFRSTFGGLFVLLGLYPILDGTYHSFFTVGFAWLATGVGRLVSLVFDGGRTAKNFLATLFESGIGITMLLGFPNVWLRWWNQIVG